MVDYNRGYIRKMHTTLLNWFVNRKTTKEDKIGVKEYIYKKYRFSQFEDITVFYKHITQHKHWVLLGVKDHEYGTSKEWNSAMTGTLYENGYFTLTLLG